MLNLPCKTPLRVIRSTTSSRRIITAVPALAGRRASVVNAGRRLASAGAYSVVPSREMIVVRRGHCAYICRDGVVPRASPPCQSCPSQETIPAHCGIPWTPGSGFDLTSTPTLLTSDTLLNALSAFAGF